MRESAWVCWLCSCSAWIARPWRRPERLPWLSHPSYSVSDLKCLQISQIDVSNGNFPVSRPTG